MTAKEVDAFVRAAEEIYETRLKQILDPEHVNEYVAIEPQSGDHFLGTTLSEAIGAARSAYPDRISHAMRVGHKTAIHFGMYLHS